MDVTFRDESLKKADEMSPASSRAGSELPSLDSLRFDEPTEESQRFSLASTQTGEMEVG